jgi:heat-inducible transcriptional repressor
MEGPSSRGRAVLYALVTEFIASGEPVGSRTLTSKYGFDLSAATIRAELKELEDEGYLAQPHTSAGRVPTERAFRLYIDALMRVRELPREDAGRIRELFSELRPGADLMRETAKLLSDLSGVPAVLVQSRGEERKVQTLRFIPTRPGELLSVIVMSDGTVENRFIQTGSELGAAQLERVHNLLDEVVAGRTLRDLREHLGRLLHAQRDELEALRRVGASLLQAALEGAARSQDLIIEGRSRLMDGKLAPADRLRELMLALEDREELLRLLDCTLASSEVQVFLGEETARVAGHPVSVVAAPYRRGDSTAGGAVGIVGPTRMDYPFLVPLVGTTAAAMTRALAGKAWDDAELDGRSRTQGAAAPDSRVDREKGRDA